MSKVTTKLDRSVALKKVILAEPMYELSAGVLSQLYMPTACDKKLREIRDCLKENVRVTARINPESPPYWTWHERAFLIVYVWNKTAAFCLTEVNISLFGPWALEGRASVKIEGDGPRTKTIDSILPGLIRSVSFPLVCEEEFQGDDRIRATVRVTCNAIPYVRKYQSSEEEVLRGS